MIDLRQWVKSAGLHWSLWWQCCQEYCPNWAGLDAAEVLGGPRFLGHPSGKPRAPTRPHPPFNSVPPLLSAFHGHIKSRVELQKAYAAAAAANHPAVSSL